MKLLVVDDDPDLVDIIAYTLRKDSHQVSVATSGEEALALAAQDPPEMVILDVMLPGLDGFEVCRRLRQHAPLPVILLTARGEEADRVWGLDLGADDYITKPFSHKELLARVRAVARRAALARTPDQGNLRVGELSIDFGERDVRIGNRSVDLTPKEYAILHCLMLNAGRVVPHDTLLSFAWGSNHLDGDVEMLKVHVRHLREKIERNPSAPDYLLTVRGVGYRMRRPTDGASAGMRDDK
ncbi:MAG TPA: response regulator transcription factor [Chloroflexota bacterium]|nr:response regulator transcription factor [Chloroflexota bacterium]